MSMSRPHPAKLFAAGLAFVIYAVGAILSAHAQTSSTAIRSGNPSMFLALVAALLIGLALYLTLGQLEKYRHPRHKLKSPTRKKSSRR